EEHAEEPFSVDDVAGSLVEKLIHRHPHVFGDSTPPCTRSDCAPRTPAPPKDGSRSPGPVSPCTRSEPPSSGYA
ncbi:MazG nucleotide pyrophosphohydrolase domain-containing protein, partial [Streptomyces goshikiensis]